MMMMHHMVAILQLMMGGPFPYNWFSSSIRHDPIRVAMQSMNRNFSLRSKKLRTPATTTTKDYVKEAAPVIGILAQPLFRVNATTYEDLYIAASYVKWLEAGGGRSIPIPYDTQSTELLDDLFGQINGLFLPGGDSTLPFAIHYLLQKADDSNRRGAYFPVWGTCLGFEFLMEFFGGDAAMQSGFNSTNISLPLLINPKTYRQSSRLYNDTNVYTSVTQYPITMNNHHQGIEPLRLAQNPSLEQLWHVTSTNVDLNGRPFVSTAEPKDPESFPFYGVQYHPEKNAFEYATYPNTNIPYEAIDHSATAVSFSIYMAQFFLNLVRYGQIHNREHSYTMVEQFPTMSAYPIETGIKYEQRFIIPKATFYESYYKNHTTYG
jgi:gamma-glutamyl hydrolase